MIAFFKKHAWIWLAILSLIIIPQSLDIQSELNMRVIVTAMAIDYQEGEYEVTAQIIKPKGGNGGPSDTGLDFISAKGKSITEGVNQVSYKIGKTAGLGHVSTIILSEDLIKQEKLMSAVDYVVRDQKIPPTCMIVVSEDSAKDELKKTKSLTTETAVELQKLFIFKEHSMNGIMVPAENFINNNLKVGATAMLSGFKLEDEKEKESGSSSGGSSGGGSSGGESSGSSSGGSQSSGGAEEQTQRFKFKNNIYVTKSGKLVAKIDDEKAIDGIMYANPNSTTGVVTVKGVTDEEHYKDATVAVIVRDKRVKFKTDFKDGKPICKITVTTSRNEVVEIGNDGKELEDNLLIQKTYLTDSLIEKMQEEIKANIKEAFKQTQEAGADIFNLGSRLYRYHAKEWDKFFEQFGEDYIKQIDLEVEVKINKQL